ncbi:MAG TPA: FGGY-family carbohydrate kinase [Acidimicrobiales bacterium]|nr:FGGY-family carbohydrate kinase [Acidimicrobiales bacterium]
MSHPQDLTVGIDIGTTSVKGVVVDGRGTIIERVRVPHRVNVPAPDRFEHDANRAWRAGPRRVLARLAAHGPRAVAVSTMVPSLTAVDRRGRALTPGLLYGDARGREGVERSSTSDAGEVVGFLGWTAAAAPGASGYWPAPAVANFALAGEAVIDIGTAFTSAPLFGGSGWDEAVAASCGAGVGQLPRIEMMGTAAGHVTATGTVLAVGGIDAMCESLVSDGKRAGDVLVNCGTTLIPWLYTSTEVSAPGLWSMPTMTPGMWSAGGPSNAGGLFLGWVERLVGPVRPGDAAEPGNVPIWVPYIRGERVPHHDPHRRASLHDLNLTHGPAAVRRAAFEAAGFVVRHVIDLAGAPAKRVVALGGGTRVDGWMQALADCTGLPVHVAAAPEGAALGAAWLARVAVGLEEGLDGAAAWASTARVVEPAPAWVGPAAERYARFRTLVAA